MVIKGPLPTLLVSSVIRGAHLGESHGGLYLVDLDRRSVTLKLDWNHADIDFSGRGGDRGLRGIAFHGDHILVAANAQLLMLDRDFRLLDSFTNPYLRHCHEICVTQDRVFLTATGFDSILSFDLKSKRFVHGWHVSVQGEALTIRSYDPLGTGGPPEGHRLHLNSVSATAGALYFSGLHTPGLLHSDGKSLRLAAPLPQGTHNAQVLDEGILYNDTASDRVCYRHGAATLELPVPDFPPGQILHLERFASDVARPRFARGLCVLGGGLVAGGSSPSTISLYDLAARTRVLDLNLSMDVRNAIHGLALWRLL
jgi:hypothetical protein